MQRQIDEASGKVMASLQKLAIQTTQKPPSWFFGRFWKSEGEIGLHNTP